MLMLVIWQDQNITGSLTLYDPVPYFCLLWEGLAPTSLGCMVAIWGNHHGHTSTLRALCHAANPTLQHLIPFFFCKSEQKPLLLCLLPSETAPKCEDASTTNIILWINIAWLIVFWVMNKYGQLINVQFLLLRLNTWWSSQKSCFMTFVVECQTMKMHQPPQHSCE